MRSGPGAQNTIVGALAHDARNVEITGVSENGKWGQTNASEGSGWVSMRFLKAVPEDDYVLTQVLSCHGTEPFWSFDVVQGQSGRLETPETSVTFHAGPASSCLRTA